MPDFSDPLSQSQTQSPNHTMNNHPAQALARWFASPYGQYLFAWEAAQVNKVVSHFFGYHAVQLGLPQLHGLAHSRMRMAAYIVANPALLDDVKQSTTLAQDGIHWNRANRTQSTAPVPPTMQPSSPRTYLLSDYDTLPFADESIDLVILPHAFEFAEDPHALLREVNRVLIPEGRMVVTGFNPLSLLGMRQQLSHLTQGLVLPNALHISPILPRQGQFITLNRVKDWLKVLGMDINQGAIGCYAMPSQHQAIQRQAIQRDIKHTTSWLEKAGNRWWPMAGAVWLLAATKHRPELRMIKPRWRKKSPVSRGLAVVRHSTHSED
jgi:SAM-dependent methyltransferase